MIIFNRIKFLFIILIITICIFNNIQSAKFLETFLSYSENSKGDFDMYNEILKNVIMKGLKTQTVNLENKKEINKDYTLNITDYSLNAMLFMAQRAFHIDISAKNDSSNPLPLNIDTASLNLLVEELNRYEKNLNMSLRIFEDPSIHTVPKLVTDIDGSYFSFNVGMEFGLFENETVIEPLTLLSIGLPIKAKLQFDTTDNKLTIVINEITVDNITLYADNLAVDLNKIKMSISNFLKVAVKGVKEQITNIDLITKFNEFTGADFSKLEIITDYGFTLIYIK